MKKADPSVSIILVNWNNAADTLDCIRSLKLIDYSRYSIVVVDNASSGDDAEMLERECGEAITVLRSEKNLGFSGGNNLGIIHALNQDAAYVLLLNNDTVVDPSFLRPLVETCERNEQCGMAVPKICYHSNPSVIWAAGGVLSKIRASGFSRGEGEDAARYTGESRSTFASGCCVLIKAAVIREVGLWDESYFLYVEDVDYSYRAYLHGYMIGYVGRSIIYHKVNRTTARVHSLLPMYYTTRNRFFFKDKLGRGGALLAGAYLWLVFCLKCAWWAMRGERGMLRIYIRAASDYRNGVTGYVQISAKNFQEAHQ